MHHISLYRKYRPMNFNEVVGQQNIVKTLTNQVQRDEVSHAYLFSGPRGTGKTSIAKIFSRAINCTNSSNQKPCNSCDVCVTINSNATLDVIEMDGASHNKVEDIRDINEIVNYSPNICKYKVLIIDEAHMLSNSAFNALLKTLEEPLSHMVFILATTEIHKIPATILSRCQRYEFRRISEIDVVDSMKEICKKEGVSFEIEALKLISSQCDGALRDALSMLEQVISYSDSSISYSKTVEILGLSFDSELLELLENILQSKTTRALENISSFRDMGKNAKNLVDDISRLINKITKDILSEKIEEESNYEIRKWLEKNSKQINLKKMIWMQNIILKEDYRYSSNHWISIDSLIIRLSNIETDSSKDALLIRIEQIENMVNNIKSGNNYLNRVDDASKTNDEKHKESSIINNYIDSGHENIHVEKPIISDENISKKTLNYDIIKESDEKKKNELEFRATEDENVTETIDIDEGKVAAGLQNNTDNSQKHFKMSQIKSSWDSFLDSICSKDAAIGSIIKLTKPVDIDSKNSLCLEIEEGFDFIQDELQEKESRKMISEVLHRRFEIDSYEVYEYGKIKKSNVEIEIDSSITKRKLEVSNEEKSLDEESRLKELFGSLGEDLIFLED